MWHLSLDPKWEAGSYERWDRDGSDIYTILIQGRVWRLIYPSIKGYGANPMWKDFGTFEEAVFYAERCPLGK